MPSTRKARRYLFAGFGLIAFNTGMASAHEVFTGFGPQCGKASINRLAERHEGNAVIDDHAHGDRKWAPNPSLLSEIG